MSAIEGLPLLVWVVTGVWLYLVRRRRRRGKDWRFVFWSTLGLEFCLLAVSSGSFVIRHFGHTALFIWVFATFGLGIAFIGLSVRYETKDGGESGTR